MNILWKTLFVASVVIFAGCATQGHYVRGPDGKMSYELPEAPKGNLTEAHCNGVEIFSEKIAGWRSHTEYHDNQKPVIVPNDKVASFEDFKRETADLERFTPRGERNYNKMWELFDRIVMKDQYHDKTPEQIGQIIYKECTQKMAKGTWFKKPSPQEEQLAEKFPRIPI